MTAKAATPVPKDVDLALAAAFGSVATAAWAAVVDLGALQPGERVGVTGASGAVGSLVAQLAVRGDAGGVVAWTRSPERAGGLPGAVQVVALDEPAEPVDLLVDTVGGPGLGERLGLVRPGGRAVLVGYTAGTDVALSLPQLMARDVALLPLNMMRRRVPRDVESGLLADAAAGRLRLPVETVAPEEVASAIERLVAGATSGRLVVAW